jgi:phage-related protein
MGWPIFAFESERGDKPVEEFIKSLDPSTIAKASHHVNLLEVYGNRLGMPHSRKLTLRLYELRVRGKMEVRIIYAFVKGNIYLLHAFKKQTNKTPSREIDTSLQRLRRIEQPIDPI